MPAQLQTLGARAVLVWDTPITHPTDPIGGALETGAEVVVLPVEVLPEGFLRLSTGVAGEMLQKFVNYRLLPVVLGDIGEAVAASDALRDFVRESNRGNMVWFVADMAELEARLSS